MTHAAYAGVLKSQESPRDLEIRAISHITRNLIDATTQGVEPMDRTRALNGNIRLWSLLVKDLFSPDNLLPEDIKANLISIGIWARRTSLAALTRPEMDLKPLIRINTDLLEALDLQRNAGQATPAGMTPPGITPPGITQASISKAGVNLASAR